LGSDGPARPLISVVTTVRNEEAHLGRLLDSLTGQDGPFEIVLVDAVSRDRTVAIAEAYARMGEKEQAYAWLERAYTEQDSGMVSLGVEPIFEDMRRDPRFQDLLRRLNLPNSRQ
jgi:cellulose synthase/poly-beta-1,6-N-acetylglucosamine synthase-like glycosyltransferase